VTEIRNKLGQRLRELRREHRLSQDALAHAARMDRVFLGQVERGEKAASVETIEKIARALGVSPRDLFDFESRPNPSPTASDRLGWRVAALARTAPAREIARFEEVAEAFFRAYRPRRRGAR
jgi:transcriptional regulator with XRE-family HTH domain